MTISGFVAYVKQLWKNKPDTSTPLSAARLLHLEDGVKGNSDAIEKIAAAVVSVITNDPNKIASMAALYAVNQTLTQLNSEFASWKLISRYIEIDPGINYWFSSDKLVTAGANAKYQPVVVSVMETLPDYYITSAVFSEYGTLGIKLNKANPNTTKIAMTISILYLAN